MTGFAGGAEPPRPGDHSVCAYCRVYLVIEADSVRLMTNAEWFALTPKQRATLAYVRETMPRLPE